MRGSFGEKIGEGVFGDVRAGAPGQVVKLSKPGILQWVVQHETQMTRAVFAAGGSAPEVLGESPWTAVLASCCRGSMGRP